MRYWSGDMPHIKSSRISVSGLYEFYCIIFICIYLLTFKSIQKCWKTQRYKTSPNKSIIHAKQLQSKITMNTILQMYTKVNETLNA
jgi:hypothetical protein